MTDTHTHIYMPQFDDGGHEALGRAVAAGVGRMILPGVSPGSVPSMLALAAAHPGHTAVAMGLHPTDVTSDWRVDLDETLRLHRESGLEICAVGEVGMDLYWTRDNLEWQREAFAAQLETAARLGVPVIIHCREALEETLGVIERHRDSHGGALPRLIFHSFTGGPGDVARIREVCDPWFGINGVVTFRNAAPLREALPVIGLERLLLETDSPYLAPVPHRGRRNESALLPLVCRAVAEALGIGAAEVEEATDRNAGLLFGTGVRP